MKRFERGNIPHSLYQRDSMAGRGSNNKVGEHTMTPKRYNEIFGKPYVIRFSVPTITIQDGQPVVSVTEKTISADDWQKLYGTDIQIPMVTPTVKFSPTDG